ncbi:MAG: hypothetical protein HY566_03300 [Candidatus Kerfeldbacteria bacterium]|nr:hypothetical protein [Candidatus Kerfeldbacteria bacterium]
MFKGILQLLFLLLLVGLFFPNVAATVGHLLTTFVELLDRLVTLLASRVAF